jgi:hypothetical protein
VYIQHLTWALYENADTVPIFKTSIVTEQSDFFKGDFLNFFFLFTIFICRLSDSTVSEDVGIESRTVATTALAVRRSNHSDRSHPQVDENTQININMDS